MNLPIQLWAHFLLMALMILLMIIAIVKAHKKSTNWLNFHRKYALGGVISGIIGFIIMAISKQLNAYPHFSSNHSKGGLVALILLLITPILGTMLLKKLLKQKMMHKIFGILTLIFCILAASAGILKILN